MVFDTATMKKNLLLLLAVAAFVSTHSVQCSIINKSALESTELISHRLTDGELQEEPILQPRWFGWGGNKKEEGKNVTGAKEGDGGDDINNVDLSALLGKDGTIERFLENVQNGNGSLEENLLSAGLSSLGDDGTLGKVAELIKNSGNKSIQENLVSFAAEAALNKFGGDESIKNLIITLQNPGNKTIQENLMNVATEAALAKFGDNEAVKNIANIIKNSGNNTMQENLINVATEAALAKFGDNEAVKNIANILKNSGNNTMQENLIDVATEAALAKFGDNEAVKNIANILKNSDNKTMQENLMNVAAEAALAKFGDNEAVKNIANILKNSGNKTMQENLMSIASEAALAKFGDNEVVKKIANVFKTSGNQTVKQKVLTLATDFAMTKFKDNALFKSALKIFNNTDGTIQEKLSAATDAALSSTLGPVGAAVAKQGINAVGQALKLGGGLFGGLLKKIGGNSPIGKIGDAIKGGSAAAGGFMSGVATGQTSGKTAITPAKSEADKDSKAVEEVKEELAKIESTFNPVENSKVVSKAVENAGLINQAISKLEGNAKDEPGSSDVLSKAGAVEQHLESIDQIINKKAATATTGFVRSSSKATQAVVSPDVQTPNNAKTMYNGFGGKDLSQLITAGPSSSGGISRAVFQNGVPMSYNAGYFPSSTGQLLTTASGPSGKVFGTYTGNSLPTSYGKTSTLANGRVPTMNMEITTVKIKMPNGPINQVPKSS